MLMSAGEGGKTLLSLAVRSSSKCAFEAVLAALSSEEVCISLNAARDVSGSFSQATTNGVTTPNTANELLIAAAKSGSIELWQAVSREVSERSMVLAFDQCAPCSVVCGRNLLEHVTHFQKTEKCCQGCSLLRATST